jgi:hypothetical protein
MADSVSGALSARESLMVFALELAHLAFVIAPPMSVGHELLLANVETSVSLAVLGCVALLAAPDI